MHIDYHKVEMLQHSERANEEIVLVHISTDAMHEGTDTTAVDQYITLNHSASWAGEGERKRGKESRDCNSFHCGILSASGTARTWLAIAKC